MLGAPVTPTYATNQTSLFSLSEILGFISAYYLLGELSEKKF